MWRSLQPHHYHGDQLVPFKRQCSVVQLPRQPIWISFFTTSGPLLPSTSLFPLPPPYLLHYRSGLLSDRQRRLSTLFSLPSFLSSLSCVASHAAWNSDLPANLARLFALPSFLLLLPSPSSSSSFLLLLLFS